MFLRQIAVELGVDKRHSRGRRDDESPYRISFCRMKELTAIAALAGLNCNDFSMIVLVITSHEATLSSGLTGAFS